MKKQAFTLVELIVVITILAILATIGFVSFSGYLAGTRDTNRISQLKSMSDALELYRTKKDLPIPDDKVDVQSSGTTIAYQGYIGANVLETIEYTEKGLDPKDKQYFSYMLSKNNKYFQLLTFLEETNQDVIAKNDIFNFSQAVDYSDRFPKAQGKKLGILIDAQKTPIQEVPSIISSGSLDILTTNDVYTGIMQDDYSVTGTGAELKIVESSIYVGGVRNSCKIMLEQNPNIKGKDGYYLINQNKPTKVYCDMTTDGGGWSRYVNITGDYSFDDAKNCWLSDETIQNDTGTIECYNPNRLNFLVEDFMVVEDDDHDSNTPMNKYFHSFANDQPSQIIKTARSKRRCKGGEEYMSVMSVVDDADIPNVDIGHPDSTLSNLSHVRMGLNYCEEDGREVGGISKGGSFMNYATVNSGTVPTGPSRVPTSYSTGADGSTNKVNGGRENKPADTQLFIR